MIPTASSPEPAPRRPLRLVALGDSYTIGTGVDPDERFPDLLVAAVGQASIELVANLGVDGYTTTDLIRDELPVLATLRPGFATVLIGVNDVVRDLSIEAYRRNVATILEALRGSLPADGIVTISVPDYTVTPNGAEYGDVAGRSDAIRAVNEVMASASAERGITHVDIHDLSLRAAEDRTLVATDRLHPSGAQYALWVERLAPAVRDLLVG